jgi:hypothetical protein
MKSVIRVPLIVIAVAIVASLAWLYLSMTFPRAGGDMLAEQRTLPPFSRIAVEGLVDVMLVQGSTESVSVEAPSKHLAGVRTDVSDGTLTIATNQTRRWWSNFFGGATRPARVTVNFRTLDAIEAAGMVKLRADQLRTERLKVSASGATSLKIASLDAKELAVSGAGAMKFEIAGRATEQRVAISGAGDYRAADLASDDARVSVSGAGRVVVRVEKTLKIGLSGAGSVEYLGNPKVTQSISGAGRVKRREAAETPHTIAQPAAQASAS